MSVGTEINSGLPMQAILRQQKHQVSSRLDALQEAPTKYFQTKQLQTSQNQEISIVSGI
jgi:hypothetical protein